MRGPKHGYLCATYLSINEFIFLKTTLIFSENNQQPTPPPKKDLE
jgi:hypothetical protein